MPKPFEGYSKFGYGHRKPRGPGGVPQPPAAPPAKKFAGLPRERLRRWVGYACWANLVLVVAVWLTMRFAGDRWWLGTVLLFGARWIWIVPAVVLAPAALVFRRRLLWAVLAAATIVMIPIMGLSVPVSLPHHTPAPEGKLAVLSCNVDGGNMNAEAMFKLINARQPDIIMCQEWASNEAVSPVLMQLGWHVRVERGLFFASRFPIISATLVPTKEKWRDLAAIYQLQAPFGVITVINLHLETPRKGLEALRQGRRSQIQPVIDNMLRRQHESELVSHLARQVDGPLVVEGDFNLPADSAIFRDNWTWLDDAFSQAGLGYGYTKYMPLWGIRIDHLLTGPGWTVKSCKVQADIGSDHLPLFTKLEYSPPL